MKTKLGVLLALAFIPAATAATVTFTDKPKAARQDGKLQITFAVDETHLYATDTLNQRLTRIKLDYAAEATCEVN